MARYEDARAGWELYRASGYDLSLDEVNERLTVAGYAPVSSRTYLHYRKLERYGFKRYISINRLDVATAQDPFVDRAIRSRYRPRAVDLPVQLILHTPAGPFEVVGRTTELSEFGVALVVDDSSQVDALALKPVRRGTATTVNVLDPPGTFEGRVEEVVVGEGEVVVAIEFLRLRPISEVSGEQLLGATTLQLVLRRGDNPYLTDLGRDIYWMTQLVDVATALTSEVALGVASDGNVVAPQPRVHQLSMQSPLTLELTIAVPAGVLLLALLRGALPMAQRAAELVEAVKHWRVTDAEAIRMKAEGARVRAETRLLNAQADLAEVDAARAWEAFIDETARSVVESGAMVGDLDRVDPARLAGLMKQLAAAAAALSGDGLDDIDVEVAPDQEPEVDE